jgi:hypothetical protein
MIVKALVMTCRKTLAVSLVVMGFSLGAQAEPGQVRASAGAGNHAPLKTKRIKQKDGSVVVRLALPKRANAKAPAKSPRVAALPDQETSASRANGGTGNNPQILKEWLDAVTEPRFMTALASVAMEPGVTAKSMNKSLDPALVHNWAEFVDPNLYMRWMASGVDSTLNQAILKQLPSINLAPQSGLALISGMIPGFARAGVPLKPTLWSKAYGEGPGGQEAAREWLKLPMADPRSNPWLSNNLNYRY